MARKVETHVRIIDDLDGTMLPLGEGETIPFTFEGVSYEIDLSTEHADQLRAMMAPVIERATRRGGRKIQRKSAKAVEPDAPKESPPASNNRPYGERMARRTQLREIRTWAVEKGFPQGMAGKIRDDVREAWNAEHPDNPVPMDSREPVAAS